MQLCHQEMLANMYEFLTSKEVLPEKDFLEKYAKMEKFEYSHLDKELIPQTNIAKKRCQK